MMKSGQCAQRGGEDHRHLDHPRDRTPEVGEELQERIGLALLELVGSVLEESLLGNVLGEAIRRRPESIQQVVEGDLRKVVVARLGRSGVRPVLGWPDSGPSVGAEAVTWPGPWPGPPARPLFPTSRPGALRRRPTGRSWPADRWPPRTGTQPRPWGPSSRPGTTGPVGRPGWCGRWVGPWGVPKSVSTLATSVRITRASASRSGGQQCGGQVLVDDRLGPVQPARPCPGSPGYRPRRRRSRGPSPTSLPWWPARPWPPVRARLLRGARRRRRAGPANPGPRPALGLDLRVDGSDELGGAGEGGVVGGHLRSGRSG